MLRAMEQLEHAIRACGWQIEKYENQLDNARIYGTLLEISAINSLISEKMDEQAELREAHRQLAKSADKALEAL